MGSATAPRCMRRQVRQHQERRRQSGSIAIQPARVKAAQKRPLPTSSARGICLCLRLRRRVTHATRPVLRPGAPTRRGRCLRGRHRRRCGCRLAPTRWHRLDLPPRRRLDAAVSPNGHRLYVANIDSTDVSVVSTSSGNTTDTIPVGSSPNSIVHHPNGTRVYVGRSPDGFISVIDTRNQDGHQQHPATAAAMVVGDQL
jgi:YVTN family beta-propeller protein